MWTPDIRRIHPEGGPDLVKDISAGMDEECTLQVASMNVCW